MAKLGLVRWWHLKNPKRELNDHEAVKEELEEGGGQDMAQRKSKYF